MTDEVVQRQLGLRRQPEGACELARRRRLEHGAVLEQRDRHLRLGDPGRGEDPLCLLLLDVEPAIGEVVARQQVAQRVALGEEARADEPDVLDLRGRLGSHASSRSVTTG
jgi:hypothetical protein